MFFGGEEVRIMYPLLSETSHYGIRVRFQNLKSGDVSTTCQEFEEKKVRVV